MEPTDEKHARLPTPPNIAGPGSTFDQHRTSVAHLTNLTRNTSGTEMGNGGRTGGPTGPPTDKLLTLKNDAREHQARLVCKKAAAIEYNATPDLYSELYGVDLQWAATLLASSGGSLSGDKFVWCTVNPDYATLELTVEAQVTRILQSFRQLIALSWVRRWWMVIEQRNSWPQDEHPDGLHTHFIIERGTYEPSRCERDITRHFIAICGHSKHIVVKNLPEKYFMQKYRYMLGQKKEDQAGKPEMDAIMRKDWKIPEMMTDEAPGIVDHYEDEEYPQANLPRLGSPENEVDDEEEGSEQSWNGEIREDNP